MTLLGHIIGGRIVPDEAITLPEGAAVRIEVVETVVTDADATPMTSERDETFGQKLLKYAGKAKGLPTDLARNHDHYIHGTPRE